MKKSDFNALMAHIEDELQGFKRHYKLYGEVYMLRNNDKTKGIEFRFRTPSTLQVQKYDFIKNELNKIIGDNVTNESVYKLSALQSIEILQFFEYCIKV